MGETYIQEQLINYNSLTKKLNKKPKELRFEDIALLSDYKKALPKFLLVFKNTVLGDNSTLKNNKIYILGTEIKLSFGGLHSGYLKEKEDDLAEESKIQESDSDLEINESIKQSSKKRLLEISDANYLIVDLDVQSFYVAIIQKLFNKFDDLEKYNFFKNLNDMRVKLKKEKNPLQAVYKLITLSITGKFKSETSPVYDPLMYFSMTLNGQLILTEFLLRAEEENLIVAILGANTDGCTVKLKKENLQNFQNFVTEFEKEFSINFDTFSYIKGMLALSVNKYILLYESGENKVKGFSSNEFEIIPLFLVQLLNKLGENILEENLIYNTFKEVYEIEMQNTKIFNSKFLSFVTNVEKKAFFASNIPDSFSGLSVNYFNFSKKFYVKEFNILNFILRFAKYLEENNNSNKN